MDEEAIKDFTPAKVAESAKQACDKAEEKLNAKLRNNEAHIIQAERVMEEAQTADLSQSSKAKEEKTSINWKTSNNFRPQVTLKPQIL